MARIKTVELRKLNKADLERQLEEQKKELASLRVVQATGSSQSKVSRILHTRKAIARIHTVINEAQRANLRKFYAGKKYIPTDLRAKKTRAIRRRLTKEELSAKTRRQEVRKRHFPLRRYAVKA